MSSSAPLTSSTYLALDLSRAGAPRSWAGQGDAESEAFIMGRLSGLASIADRTGVDLIALDSTFRLGGVKRRDDWLDGALAVSRLGHHTSRVQLAASVPLGVTAPHQVTSAVASVHKSTSGRAAWQVDAGAWRAPARAVDAVVAGLSAPRVSRRTGGDLGPRPAVVVSVLDQLDVELAAARADVARIRATTHEEAATLRAGIRAAAAEWGRDPDAVRVIADVHVVLGADDEGARARADLLDEVDGATATAGAWSFVGTSDGFVDIAEQWVRSGAVDGFALIPASLPTDVLAVVTEVVPALRERGLRDVDKATSLPLPANEASVARPATRAAAPVRSGRRRAVAV